ncbi:hypothetical protein Cme02nite_30360 [Catellatospora methionotrophica]|uniref:FxsC-like protein n=1 Tax=Catellatospora methionotrophica TaxID=121620 RepID=A0A8J3PFH2_9ACTN|nr:hypothetical protein [Catellatospora methionotrophica]GIG14704.1 hypothetical protein Cme02nite_30360 [Catellatospora methionotrophica]
MSGDTVLHQESAPLYFFLNYAHTHGGDPYVNGFFDDLTQAVRDAAGLAAEPVGYLGQAPDLETDRHGAHRAALGSAQVLVPLYSPLYLKMSQPQQERDAYLKRLTTAGVSAVDRHVMPVIWVPLTSWDRRPDDFAAALELGADAPIYPKDGMRALYMLAPYRTSYQRVLHRLAQRIVDSAKWHHLPPSPAPNPGESPATTADDAQFIIAVLAPEQEEPAIRSWRPFTGHPQVRPADYAVGVAERLGSATFAGDYAMTRDRFEHCPTLILIDPRCAATPEGARQLTAALQNLPTWVTPLVVIDRAGPDGEQSALLADRIDNGLTALGAPPVERVTEVEEFQTSLSSTSASHLAQLISQARRRYLKYGRVFPPAENPAERLTLRNPGSSTLQTGTDSDE